MNPNPPTLTLTISKPFSKNAMEAFRARNRWGGKQFTRAYKAWRDAMGWEIRQQMRLSGASEIRGAYDIALELPSSWRGDQQNICDPLFDLLQRAGVIRDDKGTASGVPMQAVDRPDVLIRLWDLGGPEFPLPRFRLHHPRARRPDASRISRARRAGVLV